MKITSGETHITIRRDESDPKFKTDSQLLYHLAKTLNRIEKPTYRHQWIKVRMAKDGHLVDDLQHYVVTRDREFAIYQLDYAIRDSYQAFNRGDDVTLGVAGNIDIGQIINMQGA